MEYLAYLREFNMASVLVRLSLAMLCSGILGLERGRKQRAAGFRTYMLVGLGAALAMLLGQYETQMLRTQWAHPGIGTDVARFGAQVINGIGFLGAGTILVTRRQSVKGLTTAAGLWASACLGLAAGAGFYECVLIAFCGIFLAIRILPELERYFVENARNRNLYIEFHSLGNIRQIVNCIKNLNVTIYDVDIDHGNHTASRKYSAVVALRLNRSWDKTQLLWELSKLECVYFVEDI